MREILFKAKQLDNGEWVEGDLIHSFDGENRFAISNAAGLYEIVPYTICQYTGLNDKNGNKIWENDVVKHVEECGVYKCSYDLYNCEYQFDNKNESFGMGYASIHKFEVIGNIFDNPELLKNK